MEYSVIYAGIKVVIREIKNDPSLEISADDTLEDLGFSANAVIGLAVPLSAYFGIEISIQEAAALTTVRSIAQLIKTKVG